MYKKKKWKEKEVNIVEKGMKEDFEWELFG